MVEMHLLSVNVDFEYDPIYALGVVSSFDQFMEGYSPEGDKASIFASLCQALESDANAYRAEAQQVQEQIKDWSGEAVVALLCDPHQGEGADGLRERLKAIAANPKFKYSRLFAIGLYTLISTVDPERLQSEESRNQAFEKIAQGLGISLEKLLKDIELYRSNLEKMKQAQAVMKDILEAERKKRQERILQKEPSAASASSSETTEDSQE